jgi:hypothetical protein
MVDVAHLAVDNCTARLGRSAPRSAPAGHACNLVVHGHLATTPTHAPLPESSSWLDLSNQMGPGWELALGEALPSPRLLLAWRQLLKHPCKATPKRTS